jgi:hypothetical protein
MSGYTINLQNATTEYNSLAPFDIDANINALDNALIAYSSNPSSSTRAAVTTAFTPIATYYSSLSEINTKLQKYLSQASVSVSESQNSILNEERYDERKYPEEYVKSREIMHGIFPKLRTTSIPYLLSASIFMALLSIFLIFQLLGVTGQFNLPASLTQWSTPAIGAIPFYKNPMILSGVIILLSLAVVIFAVMYFNRKNTNSK